MRFGAVPLAAAIAVLSAAANAQTAAPGDAAAPAAAAGPAPPIAVPALAPADAGAKGEAEQAASRQAVQDLEAQVIELRRIIEAFDRSRASVDDLRRRIDELEARLGENDRRDEALATGAGREASLFRFRNDGFALRSPNGRFLLIPHLRLQTVYEGALVSRGSADPAAPDRSAFALTHAELILEGQVGSRLFTYRLQLDAAEAPAINDAYVQVGSLRSVAVRAGRFKVPYGFQRWTWSGELQFVTISEPMAAFSLERDVGLMAIGRPFAGRLAYEFAVINGGGPGQPVPAGQAQALAQGQGQGQGQGNDNIDLAYALRVVAAPFGPLTPGEGDLEWHPRPRASLGVAGYYNLVPTDVVARSNDPTANTDQDRDGRFDNVAVWQGNVELRALWHGAALQAEWFGRYEKPGGLYSSRSFWGGYAQASYFVIRGRLEVAARIGRTDEPRYGSTPADRARLGNQVDEQSAAVNAYLRGHRLKVQVDYTHSHAKDTTTGLAALSGPDVNRVRAALQLAF